MGIPFFVLLQCDFAGKKNKREIQTDSRSRRDLSKMFLLFLGIWNVGNAR